MAKISRQKIVAISSKVACSEGCGDDGSGVRIVDWVETLRR